MARLRTMSTRALISPTSFVNTYHWGNFGGDPQAMVERYFDAFLYDSNFGTRQVMFRLPARLLDAGTADQYCYTDMVRTWEHGSHVIVDITLNEDGGWDFDEDSETWLSSIIPARAGLASGDLRLLYLAWLLAAQQGELEDDEVEPPVPAGLRDLSGSLLRFVQFLRLDDALVAVAAEASPGPARPGLGEEELSAWISALDGSEKDELLLRVARGDDPHVGADIRRRIRAQSPQGDTTDDDRRSVGDLLYATGMRQLEQDRHAARRQDEERLRLEERAARAAAQRRAALLDEGDKVWSRLQRMIDTKKPAEYDAVVAALIDLRPAGHDPVFEQHLERLREVNSRKPSLLARFDRARIGIPHTG
jgi:hypothetical protein